MEIRHRVSFNSRRDAIFLSAIQPLGFKLQISPLIKGPEGESSLIAFNIVESDDRWGQVKELMDIHNIHSYYDTFFSQEEILKAEYLRIWITNAVGYPQPESTWVRDPVNYDDFCHACGTYLQTRPFTMKKEPRSSQNSFVTFHWGTPAFCSIRVHDILVAQKIRGYKPLPVLLKGGKEPSPNLIQILPVAVTEPGLVDGDVLAPVYCAECHTLKYHYHKHGTMRYQRDAIDPGLDIQYTSEWFGAGSHMAFREVLVSSHFARVIIENKWKGARFKVIDVF